MLYQDPVVLFFFSFFSYVWSLLTYLDLLERNNYDDNKKDPRTLSEDRIRVEFSADPNLALAGHRFVNS